MKRKSRPVTVRTRWFVQTVPSRRPLETSPQPPHAHPAAPLSAPLSPNPPWRGLVPSWPQMGPWDMVDRHNLISRLTWERKLCSHFLIITKLLFDSIYKYMYCVTIIRTLYFVMKRGKMGPNSSHTRPALGPTRTAPAPCPGRSGLSPPRPPINIHSCGPSAHLNPRPWPSRALNIQNNFLVYVKFVFIRTITIH